MNPYNSLAPDSRVWIYQSDRFLSGEETKKVEQLLEEFSASWTSHNRQLKAWSGVFYNLFIVLMVDETNADASGCSIDKSVAFLKQLQAQLGLNLFDRMIFTYFDGNQPIPLSKQEMELAIQNGTVQHHTLVFDNLITNKEAFENEWKKPISASWYRRFFKFEHSINS